MQLAPLPELPLSSGGSVPTVHGWLGLMVQRAQDPEREARTLHAWSRAASRQGQSEARKPVVGHAQLPCSVQIGTAAHVCNRHTCDCSQSVLKLVCGTWCSP